MSRADSAAIISAFIKLGWVKEPKKKKLKQYGAQFVFLPPKNRGGKEK